MQQTIHIYGVDIRLPNPPPLETIDGYDLPKEEQYWRRRELPDFFDTIKRDEDGNALLNAEQSEYAKEEVRRCKEGYWFMNNGVPTYVTGKNYFYLQWWKLEDDIHPNYRDADRRYYIYLNYWENVLWCLGIGRGKKRREGASSQATANIIYECIFYTNSNTGLVSKTNTDSRDTFTDMVAFGYQQLPPFLKPRQTNRESSVTELVFQAKVDKKSNKDKGLRSKVNYRAPVLNAYDRGRMSRLLADEGGKWPLDVPFSRFIGIVSKTLVQGAKRVGFCEAPSTVNEMTKGGGAEFKKFWDAADQFKSGFKKTGNRFVTYFTPSYDNYEGFIDKYGMSVIDEPTQEQYDYLVSRWVVKDPTTGETVSEISEEDIKKGARVYVLSRRNGLVGDALEEEIRMNPMSVQEMFEAANTGCHFNSFNINQRKHFLEENPVYKRRLVFYRKEDGRAMWRDITDNEKDFHWEITQMPPEGEENKSIIRDGKKHPDRINDGAIAVDSYSNSQGGRKYGSKACAWIGRRFDILRPQETGKPIGCLFGRPSMKDILHEQTMLAAEYFGYPVFYEHTADDYESYYRQRGKIAYLGMYPLSLIAPEKRENAERYKGTPITPFSLTRQMDLGIVFFNEHCDNIDWIELLDNALVFDPYDRTKYDMLVSFLILLAVLSDTGYSQTKRKQPLIKTYEPPQLQVA